MPLAFRASQQLQLDVSHQPERLAAYLTDQDRVVKALLDPNQLEPLGPGRYRYAVTHLQVFQLQIQPVVDLRIRLAQERLVLEATECELEGLGLVDDFQLTLGSWLAAGANGLEGEASLAVTVSQPSLLKLIPAKVLEATGRSLLAGILLGIKGRVGQQLLSDYRLWCQEH
ncbi:MAG: DUF1997 domain-containing protein [Prochlorococcaceae cyanobacterium MAG_34]|jgi:hypothetical protein|uniref:DUF1997 domain-containing protein n=1 Tax=Cyanobium sp. TaxID=2164130 RepID=UPI002742E6FD|nr:DUF1997 domain-containing protein [Cyanobium sp. MAG_255]MDP4706587.1 DUF1997 domain-containing protein [Cyanobium sp. MAG_237]MDP4737499.1 DUF1997 domain-containing protein [Cyanobium sp. MAG_216]MDP4807581.1 DUF1997 domain-containing protein [Cyanobium sp. MAG_160]MDP4831217.1 DUF1997 domain-containing protein [Cyanobium sp. MAG_185]MDP4881295.1 DUF1997 domain-containing protein [Cyanobium sp. MAG_137]MDP4947495.1 DUF1997 domain-containing protein [Cyanobium sp. MAG_102]MDP5119161.1 DUF